jgi:ethanolaminephosphotransferase
MLQTIGIENYSFIPDYVYSLAWNEWYMVYGGIVLVFNTVSRFVFLFCGLYRLHRSF